MQLRHTIFAPCIIGALCACTTAQDGSVLDTPQPQLAPPSAGTTSPLASFARRIDGEWKATSASGRSMYDTYHWGPGKHSVRVMTHGEDAAGNPWRGLGVVYWHPGRKQLRSLSLNPYEGSVSEGRVSSDAAGDSTETLSDLFQNGVRRRLVLRDSFDGTDKFRSSLLEEVEPGTLAPLTEWDYIRSRTITPVQPLPTENPPKPSARLQALKPLLGHAWSAKGNWSGGAGAPGEAFHIESTFEWIPYIDAIYARSLALRGNGEPVHMLDAYIYHHTGADRLRCLALSESGSVYEGDITVLDGGGLQLDLKSDEGGKAVHFIARFDFEENGTMRQRVWSVDGAAPGQTPLLDVHHTASRLPASSGR